MLQPHETNKVNTASCLSSKQTTIKSMFSDLCDQDQFMSYLKPIQQSQIATHLFIPFDILREISEFATGEIKQCSNNKCQAGICILNQHWIDFNNGHPKKWNYCPIENKYFCEICAPFTAKFICCDTIQCFKHYRKCAWNMSKDKYETMCDDYDGPSMAYQCLYCDNDNDDNRLCIEHNEWMCYFHREITKCEQGIHNICCGGIFECVKCENEVCLECANHSGGFICDKCIGFICNECMDEAKEMIGILCKQCYSWFCNECVDQQNIGKNCKFCGKFSCNKCDCCDSKWE
eukprot:529666_1